jgi:DNA repair protein RecO (recombination protein O)
MHHIYHTEAFVLGSRNVGEANKMLSLYTRELGLVYAHAQGIRLGKSKLRFGLQDFSHATVDLVQGKDIWRVTSGVAIQSYGLRLNPQSLKIIASVAKLLERLCVGEEPIPEIFDDLIATVTHLTHDHIQENYETIELVLVLRILHNLGYIGRTDTFADYLEAPIDPGSEIYKKLEKKTILFEINRALKESNL